MGKMKMWIGGNWVDADSGRTFPVFNPSTGEEIGQAPLGGPSDVDKAVKAARKAFPIWSRTVQAERSKAVGKLALLMRERAEEIARLEMLEHGSPYDNATFMAEWSTQLVEFAAQASRAVMGSVVPAMTNAVTYLKREPVGVCGLITPWNAPVMMIAAKVAPALAMGNTCIIKPPSINSLIGLMFAEMLERLDLPAGTVNIVTGPGSTVGRALAAHPGVDLIGFTGSTETGREIMSAASAGIKRTIVELGGKNPFVVLKDADVDAAVDCGVHGLYHNSGMSCASPGRFYVHEDIYDEFVEKFIGKSKEFVLGRPSDKKAALGPMASAEQRDRVEAYIRLGVEEGATLRLGGVRPTEPPLDKGYFVAPTVFTEVTQNMRIAREEIFGPVGCFIRFSSETEALELANDSNYGLCGCVWTKDMAKGMRFVNDLRAGVVWVNQYMIMTAELPWGGVKESGMGKEGSMAGIEEFTVLKLVCLEI